MANLFELTAKLADFDLVIDENGEITNADELESIELERNEKIENIALWILNLRADKKMFKEQKNVFAQKEKSAENKEKWLMTYLSRCLNGEKFKAKDGTVSIGYRKSQRVHCLGTEYLGEEYLKRKESVEPDLVAIKKAINDGEEITGCWIEEIKNIQIR